MSVSGNWGSILGLKRSYRGSFIGVGVDIRQELRVDMIMGPYTAVSKNCGSY